MTIGLHRSRLLTVILALVHGMAGVAVWLPDWPLVLSLGLSCLVAFSVSFAWRRAQPAFGQLRLFADGRIQVQMIGADDFLSAQLSPSATVYPWLTVFALTVGGSVRYPVVLVDSISPEDFRRLRVWLRWKAAASGNDNADVV